MPTDSTTRAQTITLDPCRLPYLTITVAGYNPVNLGAGGFLYLFAKYDGPNYGSEVWYVGGLTGIITIPATAGGYGLSGWTLFNPGGTNVPEGGSTIAFLGLALTAAELLRRGVSRRAAVKA